MRRTSPEPPSPRSGTTGRAWHGALHGWAQTPAGWAAETEARDTCFHGDAADPVQVGGRLATRALILGQDALHVADFTADPTAGHRLEVRAVSQGLCAKFLGRKVGERKQKTEVSREGVRTEVGVRRGESSRHQEFRGKGGMGGELPGKVKRLTPKAATLSLLYDTVI